MTRLRLPALALVVAALLAVVALVAHGRPLAADGGHGGGLPLAFWDYVLTSAVIVVALCWAAVIAGALFAPDWGGGMPRRWRTKMYVYLALLTAGVVIGVLVRRYLHLPHGHPSPVPIGVGKHPLGQGQHPHGPAHAIQFRWEEVAVVLGLLLAAVAVVLATRSRLKPPPLPALAAPAAVAAAVDESLDDLRSDPDLRRAIVAAYARMETALARAGLPRRPAEAPLEYVERALLELDLDAPAVRRLTELFEWARFSHHEPEPSMRDDAIDALVAIRDSLLAPAEAAA